MPSGTQNQCNISISPGCGSVKKIEGIIYYIFYFLSCTFMPCHYERKESRLLLCSKKKVNGLNHFLSKTGWQEKENFSKPEFI